MHESHHLLATAAADRRPAAASSLWPAVSLSTDAANSPVRYRSASERSGQPCDLPCWEESRLSKTQVGLLASPLCYGRCSWFKLESQTLSTYAFAARVIPVRIETPCDESSLSQSWSPRTASSAMLARSLVLGGICHSLGGGWRVGGRQGRTSVWTQHAAVESICGDPAFCFIGILKYLET